MNFDQVMTVDVTKESGESLQQMLDELNMTVGALKARSREVTAEINVRHARAKVSAALDGLPENARKQVIQALSIESREAVPSPGA